MVTWILGPVGRSGNDKSSLGRHKGLSYGSGSSLTDELSCFFGEMTSGEGVEAAGADDNERGVLAVR
eukprot:751991-Hanusia_phi.AAC.5